MPKWKLLLPFHGGEVNILVQHLRPGFIAGLNHIHERTKVEGNCVLHWHYILWSFLNCFKKLLKPTSEWMHDLFWNGARVGPQGTFSSSALCTAVLLYMCSLGGYVENAITQQMNSITSHVFTITSHKHTSSWHLTHKKGPISHTRVEAFHGKMLRFSCILNFHFCLQIISPCHSIYKIETKECWAHTLQQFAHVCAKI